MIAGAGFLMILFLLVATWFRQSIPIWRPPAIIVLGVIVMLTTGMAPDFAQRMKPVGIVANWTVFAMSLVVLFLSAVQIRTPIRSLLSATRCAILACLVGTLACLVVFLTYRPDVWDIIPFFGFLMLLVLLVATSFQRPIPIWRSMVILVVGVVVILTAGQHPWRPLTQWAVDNIANAAAFGMGVVLLFLGALQIRGILMRRDSQSGRNL
jgi:hypothetical protein